MLFGGQKLTRTVLFGRSRASLRGEGIKIIDMLKITARDVDEEE